MIFCKKINHTNLRKEAAMRMAGTLIPEAEMLLCINKTDIMDYIED